MTAKISPSLLEQAAQIQHMERGKLSIMREGPKGPYHKLQVWENGKNQSRYVRCDQVAAVQEALEGYHQFEKLIEQHTQQIIERTRAELAADSKKNLKQRRPNSSSPRKPKSGS